MLSPARSFSIHHRALNIGGIAARRAFKSYLCFSSKCSFKQMQDMDKGPSNDSRGALIVLEGLDRSGKTSQISRLHTYLETLGVPVESWRFPDRNTGVGQMISSYLSNQSELDDHTIHLLFSANRWEKRSLMESKLRGGTTLIVDRYSYSGVAFSCAKGLDFEWCKAPETGLLAPDIVVYLDVSPEKAAERGEYGVERYEKLEFQREVARHYQLLCDQSWKKIDACLSIEDVEKQLREIALDCISTCKNGKVLSHLWSDTDYHREGSNWSGESKLSDYGAINNRGHAMNPISKRFSENMIWKTMFSLGSRALFTSDSTSYRMI